MTAPATDLTVDIVSDVMCPWCIIGWLKFEKAMEALAGRVRLRVHWHPFELNPDMAAEGEDVTQHIMRKYGITAEQSAESSERMNTAAEDLGFAFRRGPGFRMRNSFDAHRLLHWAGTLEEAEQEAPTGVQTKLKIALFRAHFSDNRDVSDSGVLADVAASVGLDRARAAAILAGDDHADAVRAEERLWIDRGITAVPAFVLNGRFLIPGAQEPEVFVQAIERALAKAG